MYILYKPAFTLRYNTVQLPSALQAIFQVFQFIVLDLRLTDLLIWFTPTAPISFFLAAGSCFQWKRSEHSGAAKETDICEDSVETKHRAKRRKDKAALGRQDCY